MKLSDHNNLQRSDPGLYILGFINQANSLNRLAPCPREEWVAAKRGLAVQCAKKGDLPSALQNAREIVVQFPDEVSSHAFLGYLYGAMEQPVKARESFETALKLDPNHGRAKEGLLRLHTTGVGKISGGENRSPGFFF